MERANLKDGEGNPDECVWKFKREFRNKSEPIYMEMWGFIPLPVQYYINGDGQPALAIREPSFANITAPRDNTCQGDVGRTGQYGDVGGHIIASSLGGYGKRINLTPQHDVVNGSIFTSIEDAVRKCLSGNMAVQYLVRPKYSGSISMRPDGYDISVNVLHSAYDLGRLYGYINNGDHHFQSIEDVQQKSNQLRQWCAAH